MTQATKTTKRKTPGTMPVQSFRASDELMNLVRHLAAKRGLSPGQWIRTAILRSLQLPPINVVGGYIGEAMMDIKTKKGRKQ